MAPVFDSSPANLDREFPVRKNLVYFNHAAVSPLPRRVAHAIAAHNENARDRGAADWRRWYAEIEEARAKVARFLGAARDEVAFLPNTSWGLNLVAQSFPWKPGENVVTDDMEFPSNAYPWLALGKRGVECRMAKSREGRVTLDDIAAKVDARTRIVAVSWVAFHNGWVFPIEEISRFCRERGILFVLDAIQGLGALPLDVEKAGVDVLAADGHKWLLGPEGCAVFYVSDRVRDQVPPLFAGWWNIRHERGYFAYELDFYESARRYEPGTLPTANIAGLAAGVGLLYEVGLETVRSRILEVRETLKRGLIDRGWVIASPEPLRSGILAAIHPTADAHVVVKRLEEHGIITAPREGAVRFSPHFYNDPGEVFRLFEALDH
ncbi:MAG TPA: aminotransferase class V-fold PLP-dependent enzyme [Thermoanaerobaculia bacterium]|nr:aminotransferase class V-fold PLP-dependent enzyme [Thermoanaerobaculia bacterium]